jgi:two-component system LytT family sensor kinase
MAIELPIRNLKKLNWLLAFIMGGFVYLILLLNLSQHNRLLYSLMTIVVIAIIGYANIYIVVLLNRKFGTKIKKFQRFRYIFSYLASATAYLVLWPMFKEYSDKKDFNIDLNSLIIITVSSVVVNTLIIKLHDLILLQNEKSYDDLEFLKLKTAHAEAANLLLRQQIQPHFLFNALTTLKSLYHKDSLSGDTYIVHLASFLRASISNQNSVSTLEQELDIVEDYLEMQKIRFGTALHFTITITGEGLDGFYLPSFSLQPLIENAIKHNGLTEEHPLVVTITQQDDRIMVSNNLQKKTSELSTHNGLANLNERYRLLSGDEIIIQETAKVFQVSLKLLTHEYRNH